MPLYRFEGLQETISPADLISYSFAVIDSNVLLIWIPVERM